MIARYATKQEVADWNTHILANPGGGNVFSGYEYAQQKRLTGYKPRFLFVDDKAITVLEKVALPFGRLWYLPKGPQVSSTKELRTVLEALKPLARRKGVFTIRVESELLRKDQKTLERYGLQKADPIIPNASTITLDISRSLDDILASLPQKGRHAIRRAERDGVTVEQVKANERNCRTMYGLLKDTAEGQFGIRSYNYYKTFWQRFEKAGYGQLFFASFEGKIVAGAYAMAFGPKSTYKDGASIRKRTAYGASHLLQWKVIEWAKSHDVQLHDFCGSPPSNEIRNPEHSHYGIGLFKTSFNKEVIDYIGCYDFVLARPSYFGWTSIGERLYRRIYFMRTKDYYY